MMKYTGLLAVILVLGAGTTSLFSAVNEPKKTAVKANAELQQKEYLYEMARHLYRWYMDEADANLISDETVVEFWVRDLNPELDEGDKSLFSEIILPCVNFCVQIKKSDYRIEELDMDVKNDLFKITNVSKVDNLPEKADYVVIRIQCQAMREYLFKTRSEIKFPEKELLDRIRTAVAAKLFKEVSELPESVRDSLQVVHLGGISPVANEVWLYWETGRTLIRFASDIDLVNPAVWDNEDLYVDLYDMDEQVVVSLDEVSGSNAYMTRDQAGRLLFNCIVLGKRVTFVPKERPTAGGNDGD